MYICIYLYVLVKGLYMIVLLNWIKRSILELFVFGLL